MSILLDALKKSEAQRRLGETPTIHTNLETGASAATSAPAWAPLTMIVASVLVMSWLGWQQYRAPDEAAASPAADSAAVAASHADPAPPGSPASTHSKESVDAEPARTPVESFRDDESQMVADAPRSGSADDVAAKRRMLGKKIEDYEREAPPGAVESLPEVAMVEIGDSQSDQPLDAGPVERAAKDSRHSRVEPHESEPISYWQVPQALREGMPEFKITVLVYADEPEDRFLLINGERLVEKEELDDGLLLEEIRRDGAVFTYRNYRFLVKS